MNTLLESISFAKGVEYLIAIAFLIAFVAFWQLIYGRRKGLATRTAALMYVSGGLLIAVGSCVATAP